MIKRPWSIHNRIAHAFLIVTLFVAAVHTGAFIYHWGRFDHLGRQIAGWEVPTHLAEQLAPLFESELQPDKLREAFADFVLIHPGVEPYLIDTTGKVLVSRYTENQIIDVAIQPIHEFLQQQGFPSEPIYGTQPFGLHHEPTPFSVAPVTVAGQPAYLYLVLLTDEGKVINNSIGDNAVLRLSIVFYVSAVLGGCAIGLGLLYMLSKRFKHLTSIVQEFKQGDYSRRADIPSRDELGMYAATFNEMADQIVQQVDQLESTDRLRRELIAGVSHDIRAPLTRIRTNVEAAREELRAGETSEALNKLERSLAACDGLNELLGDLFELSKLNADGFVANIEEFAADELIDSIVLRLQPSAHQLGISLKLEAAEGLPLVLGDQRLVARAISNITENAITYTEAGGSIVISAVHQEQAHQVRNSMQ